MVLRVLRGPIPGCCWWFSAFSRHLTNLGCGWLCEAGNTCSQCQEISPAPFSTAKISILKTHISDLADITRQKQKHVNNLRNGELAISLSHMQYNLNLSSPKRKPFCIATELVLFPWTNPYNGATIKLLSIWSISHLRVESTENIFTTYIMTQMHFLRGQPISENSIKWCLVGTFRIAALEHDIIFHMWH